MNTLLGPDRTVLVKLSACVAARNDDECDVLMRAATERAPPAAVEEMLLQTYLFLGYPIALNALARWRSVSGRAVQEAPADDQSDWALRGEQVCGTVYAGQYADLRQNIRRIHPDMERWMVEEGYGKVLGRPGITLVDRELCIIALLTVLDVPRQLYSHLRGARNAGASDGEVGEALLLGCEFATEGARRTAMDTWDTVRARSRQGG